MNIALWVLQVVLGIFFVVHAYLLLRPPASLQSGMNYILEMPAGLRRFAAIAEDWRAWHWSSHRCSAS